MAVTDSIMTITNKFLPMLLISILSCLTFFVNGLMAQQAPSRNTSGNDLVFEGTFKWNPAKSENVAELLVAVRDLPVERKKTLEAFFRQDDRISVQVSNGTLKLAAGYDSPTTVAADGVARKEIRDGAEVKVRASVTRGELHLTVMGPEVDFRTTFELNGNELRVTKRVSAAFLSDPIFQETFYDRVSTLAIFPKTSQTPSVKGTTNANTFIVPNGTIITGMLQNDIVTGISQDFDKFRIMVNAPSEFDGAIIGGYVTGVSRSGRVSGRATVTFNFETITMRDGKTYDFGGYLASVTDVNGRTVITDQEGTAKGDSQTKEAAKRTGIGAGVGAVIGGILGGGQGAAVGAVLGGGAGAGSVIAQGKDDLRITRGSSISIHATAPR
jgi:hypothetical protein